MTVETMLRVGPVTYQLTLVVLGEMWTRGPCLSLGAIAHRVGERMDRLRAALDLPWMEGL